MLVSTGNTKSIGFKGFREKGKQMEKNMASEAKKMNGAGGGGFRAKLEHVLYSGEKKHVFGGIAVIGVLFGVPWYFMTRGSSF